MKKVLKWTVIVVGVLHLRHRESFGHSVLRSRQRVPRDWTHHSNAGSPWARGHRRRPRICLAYNETADIKAVTEYVKATYTDIPVIVMGLSMGGGVAIRSIGENDDIDALITLSASAGVCQECCG